MSLRIYLLKKGMTIAQFARSIDFQPSYIAAIARGKVKAGRKVARIIEMATDGQIKAEEIIAIYTERNLTEKNLSE